MNINDECMYLKGNSCFLLKDTKCKGICTFKITEREFDYNRKAAEQKLYDKGLEPYIKVCSDGTKIMSTRRISDECEKV